MSGARTSIAEAVVLGHPPYSLEDEIRRCWSLCEAQQRFVRKADDTDSTPRARDDGQYAEPSFSGPKAVLNYLSRYTHRVAIANSRLVALDHRGVTFKWKDYRAKQQVRYKTMTVHADEFIRRFLIHTLPSGFHRIRHYGWFANTQRSDAFAKARALLQCPSNDAHIHRDHHPHNHPLTCPNCGATRVIIHVFERAHQVRAPPSHRVRL